MMEDPGREAATEAELNGFQEDELDLSLGLRPAASRRQMHLLNPKNLTENPAVEVFLEGSRELRLNVPNLGNGGTGSEQELDRVGFSEPQAKKEAQALRRQEARKKRGEKRKLKANALNGNASEDRLSWFEKQRAMARESEGDFSERRRKGENCNGNGAEGATVARTAMSFMVRPAGGFNSNQLNGLPYLMMPALVGSDRNGFQAVVGAGGAGGFRPYQVAENNSRHGGGGVENGKRSVSSCSGGSSPGASDYQSTSGQGGSSSDGASHSSHSYPLTITNGPTSNGAQMQTSHHHSQPSAPQPNGFVLSNSLNGRAECGSSSCQIKPSHMLKNVPNLVDMATTPSKTNPCHSQHNAEVQTQTSPSKKPIPAHNSQGECPGTNQANGVDLSKPPKPPAQQTNEAILLSEMPCVSATGNGPNGKTITGFLYRYTKSEVSIVCVCHGSSFSPAGFVEHAGGVDIENPLKHITVVPFAINS